MRPGGLTVVAGGAPAGDQLAAMAAAVAALIDAEGRGAPDPLPPAYRSRWRRAAIEEAVAAGRRP